MGLHSAKGPLWEGAGCPEGRLGERVPRFQKMLRKPIDFLSLRRGSLGRSRAIAIICELILC